MARVLATVKTWDGRKGDVEKLVGLIRTIIDNRRDAGGELFRGCEGF